MRTLFNSAARPGNMKGATDERATKFGVGAGILRALQRGDFTSLLNTLVGDVRWFVPGPKTHYPAGRAARGREAGHADPRETFGDARCRTV